LTSSMPISSLRSALLHVANCLVSNKSTKEVINGMARKEIQFS